MTKVYILLSVLVFPFLLLAQSPQKLIDKGEYDKAIEESVNRLLKGRGDKADWYATLNTAYVLADEADNTRILELKSTKMPEIWYEVFTLYLGMQKRLHTITPVSQQLRKDNVNIQFRDYKEDLKVARQNAINFQYAYANSLLKTGKQQDALMAYPELLKITRMVQEYKDTEQLMRQALGAGYKLALIEVTNSSDAALSPGFLSKIENIPLSGRERSFLDYVTKPEKGVNYPLILSVDISRFDVSPGTVNEREYTTSHKEPESLEGAYKDETKKVADKKHPDYNKCKIKEIYQVKTAVMEAELQYIDGHSGDVLFVVPIVAQNVFENKTATASGDMFACPPEVYEILNKPKKEFPKNADMIFELRKEFMFLLKGIVWDDAFIK